MDALKKMNKELLLTICFIVLGIILLSFGSIKMLTSNDGKTDDELIDNGTGDSKTEEEEMFETNTKNEKYINLLTSSIEFVKKKVTDGEYDFSLSDTLYLVPVGVDKCVTIDGVGESPYGGTWKYFYVGVKHVGDEYVYYALALDSEEYGTEIREEVEFYTVQEFVILHSSSMTPLGLKDIYFANKDVIYSDVVVEGVLSIDELEGSSELKYVTGCNKIIVASSCK